MDITAKDLGDSKKRVKLSFERDDNVVLSCILLGRGYKLLNKFDLEEGNEVILEGNKIFCVKVALRKGGKNITGGKWSCTVREVPIPDEDGDRDVQLSKA